MEIAIILLLTGVIFTQCLLFSLFFRRVESIKKSVLTSVQAYFNPPDDKTPSEFAGTVNAIADVFITKAMASVKGTLMQQASVAARNSNKIEEAITTDIVGQASPLLGMAMELMPNLRKTVTKKPDLLNYAIPFISKLTNKNALPVSGNGHSDNQTKFNL